MAVIIDARCHDKITKRKRLSTGIYISVPFCRSKCSYCNFASGVFSAGYMQKYVERVCADVREANRIAESFHGELSREVDTIYLGGGTPTTLSAEQLEKMLQVVRNEFAVSTDAEVTIECAPGTLADDVMEALLRNGANRFSFGVQSFIDQEARSVARLHDCKTVLDDIARLRQAGVNAINLDLIAGMPHQTEASWRESLRIAIETDVPHISIYMLEVDEDSRLGSELIAGGQKYHAHHVPDDDQVARFYEIACEELERAGIAQYEISNFARPGAESKHNLKYWQREPYMGFGLDAHSMLRAETRARAGGEMEAVRLQTADELPRFLEGADYVASPVSAEQAVEEEYFLGLRLNRGVSPAEIAARHGAEAQRVESVVQELMTEGMLERSGERVRLNQRSRMLSNEVFAKFLDGKISTPVTNVETVKS